MKHHYLFILFLISLIFGACSAGQVLNQQKLTQTHQGSSKKTENAYQVIEVSQGDLACYVELLNLSTKKQSTFPSTFDWCETGRLEQGQTYIIDFEEIEIADCVSIEPCDATRKEIGLKKASLYKTN